MGAQTYQPSDREILNYFYQHQHDAGFDDSAKKLISQYGLDPRHVTALTGWTGEPYDRDGPIRTPVLSKEQLAYTNAHAMSRDDFIKKYALGPGGTFLADDKGGNAASEVAGQNVADYYDTYLGPNAKLFYTTRGGEGDIIEIPITWGGGKYRDAHPYFDGYDNVNPHPESQDLGGLGEFWRQVGRPVATAAAMYFGGELLAGMGTEANVAAAALEGAEITPEAWAAMNAADQTALLESLGVDSTTAGSVAGSVAGAGGTGTAGFTPMSIGQMSAPLSSTELASLSAPSTGAAGATGLLADGNQSAAEVARLNAMNAGDPNAMLASGTVPGINTAEDLATASKLPYSDLLKKYGPSVAKLIVSGASLAAVDAAQKNGGVGSAVAGSLGAAPLNAAMTTLNSMGSDYDTIMKPWLERQVSDVTNRSNAAADQLTTMAGQTDPALAKYRQYVDRIGTDGYREQQRGSAMADVQQQSDQALASASRSLERMGVNPADGAMAGMQSVNATNTAANKAFAASNAEKNSWDQYQTALKGEFGMGQQDLQTKAGLLSKASDLGQIGLNAGLKATAIDSGYRGGLATGYTNVGNASTQATQVNNQQNQFDQKNSLGGIVAGVATDLGGKALTSIGSKVLDGIFT